MGVVYAAHDDALARKVALKVLLREATAEPPALRRLAREAQAMARIAHPNVVAVHEVGESDGLRVRRHGVGPRRHARPVVLLGREARGRTGGGASTCSLQAGRGLAAAHAGRAGPPRLQARATCWSTRAGGARARLRAGAPRHRGRRRRRLVRRPRLVRPRADAQRDDARHAGLHAAGAVRGPASRRRRATSSALRRPLREPRRGATVRRAAPRTRCCRRSAAVRSVRPRATSRRRRRCSRSSAAACPSIPRAAGPT